MILSVVIPTLNEAAEIAGAIEAVASEADEVIVVDGGSSDDTIALARNAGALVQIAPGANRAAAMNAGAALARGEVIYFVHADCRPPRGFARDIRLAMVAGAEAGCFRLRFDSNHWLLRLSGWLTRTDLDLIRFGDQSLFARDAALRAVGGFDERLSVMEDHDIVRRLRRQVGFVILPQTIIASARQYELSGVYRLQLVIYPLIVGLYHLGAPQPLLASLRHRLLRRASEGSPPSLGRPGSITTSPAPLSLGSRLAGPRQPGGDARPPKSVAREDAALRGDEE